MSSTTIVNGTPMTYLQGIQDKSTRALLIEPEVMPSHLPKVYIYAQKGTPTPQLVVGNARNQMFGDDTFDLRKKFANHQTVLSNLLNGQGNAQMIERIIPTDAGPKSNFLLSLNVLSTKVRQYVRDADGAVVINAVTGRPTLGTTTVDGYKVKWVVTNVASKTATDTDATLFGNQAKIASSQKDDTVAGDDVDSDSYPILEFWASSEGEYFNNSGIRLWAPTAARGINEKVIEANRVYPYRMAAIRRVNADSSAKVVDTEDGSPYFDFTFKSSQINPNNDAQFSLSDIFLDKYQSTGSATFADKFGDLNGMHIYQANIDKLLGDFYDVEMALINTLADVPKANAMGDFTGATDETHLFNIFSGQSSGEKHYFTFKVDENETDSSRLSESSNIFAKGGSDGTMSNAAFSLSVRAAVGEYANPDSLLMDTAVHTESILYDTGFDIDTKLAMCKFIAERKDTAVVLSTYEVDSISSDAAGEHSTAVALRTKLMMYPESDYFGTATCRGVIVGRSGVLINSQYTGRLPLTIELAVMAAKFAGAGDGKWKPEVLFDRAPNNEIKLFKDISITFSPAKQRVKDWTVGLNYPMSFTRKTLYFPAIKTVYDNDTSVLTSFFAMMVCCELQKIGERTHRHFSGSVSLTNAQLIERVNKDVLRQSAGRFAGLVQIVPNAYISDGDDARGYSWTLPIEAYFNNMKTVMSLSLQVYRMSDYQGA